MAQPKDGSKTLKEILSTDYHIPGISPRFYLPVVLLALAAVIAYTWTQKIRYSDWAFVIAILVIFVVSTISTTIQRLLRLFHRK